MKTSEFEIIYERLRLRFGNHSAVAKEIGLTPQRYRMIRNGDEDPKGTAATALRLLDAQAPDADAAA